METQIKKTVGIREEYDVLVAGGGTAGVFAAVAAARAGARTLLVEKNGLLGGTMTAGYVNFPGIFNFWDKQLITGPCWELMEELAAEGGAVLPDNDYTKKHFRQQIRVDGFQLAATLDRVCVLNGVDILLHSMISFAEEAPGGGLIVGVTGKEGLYALRARAAVDATGDANLAGMLGYERVRSKVLQPATLENRLEGYRIEDVDKDEVERVFETAIEAGELEREVFSWKSPYEMLLARRVNMHIPCPGTEDSGSKTAMELEGRRILYTILKLFRQIRGCGNIRVKVYAAECGIRESCRIVGEKTMTADKYLSGYVYDDAVSYCFYPIDLHKLDGGGVYIVYLEKGVMPTIPYGALIPRGSRYLLVAGRTVSSDTETNSAVRVQAACMSMGQVAGTAAALAAREKTCVGQVDYHRLIQALEALGATVPEKNIAQ